MDVEPFHIVLVEPEIPQNTGSIGRLCLATKTVLHLVDPLGFDISEKALRRAGLDYWKYLDVIRHETFEHYWLTKGNAPFKLMTKKTKNVLFHAEIKPGTHFLFGKETKGLPEPLLDQYPNECLILPMFDDRVRSLNLAQSAAVTLYEGIRQTRYQGSP